MQKSIAATLARNLAAYGGRETDFPLLKSHTAGQLHGFHQWVDERSCLGAFHFARGDAESLWLTVIDWKQSGEWYLVVFPVSRSGPIAELHKLVGVDGMFQFLSWTYAPSKRDGLNRERKAYFSSLYGECEVLVQLPSALTEINAFLEEVFALARIRLKADELHPEKPEPRVEVTFPEGRRVERRHYDRERSSTVVKLAKQLAKERDGRLKCACCDFDFGATYGAYAEDYIEAHHLSPLSSLGDDVVRTKVADLALVCSNCHRMLHRRRPWISRGELRQLLAP